MTKELPTGWICDYLDNVCNVEYGTRVVRKRDGGTIYPVYGGGGATFFMDTYNRQNALVVARFAMSEQCTRLVKGKFFLNDSGLTVSPKNKNFLTQSFLDWQLIALNNKIYSLGKGSAQRNLKVDMFRKLNLNIPSLPEQKQIVEKLDKIFADIDKAKANTEKNLENAKEMFRAQLTEVFNLLKTDGAQVELQNVCAKISVGGDKPAAFSKEPTSRYKIPVYANGEQNDGLLGFTDVPTISQPAITVAARGTIGFACKRMIPYCPIVRLISLIPDTEKISLDFLFYALKYLIPTGNGTSIPQLTLPTIRKFRISYPTSLDAQAKVVEKLNHLQNTTRELEKTYTKTLSILEELKQSVLQQAFSGKL